MRANLVASVDGAVTGLVSDPERRALFLGTRDGLILRVPLSDDDGTTAPEPDGTEVAVDLRSEVSTQDERGLFDLQIVDEGRAIATSYTATDGAVTVRLLGLEGSALADDVDDPVVVQVPHPYAGHNGGGLAIDRAGNLLLSLGDMDTKDEPLPLAQDPRSLLGGVIRIPAEVLSSSGSRPVEATPEMLVAKGLRNPWRISVDASEDDLWIGDVGQDAWEEIDRIDDVTDLTVPANFGWPVAEADAAFRSDVPLAGGSPLQAPAFAYPHSDDRCGVALGARYRGTQVPALDGKLVFGDLCSGDVMALDVDSDDAGSDVVTSIRGTLLGFGEDAFGELYVLTAGGDVYRLDPAGWRPPKVAASPAVDAPGSTSTVPAVATEADCRVIALLQESMRFTELGPPEMEARLGELLAALGDASAEADDARRASLDRLSQVFAAAAEEGERGGYDVSAPAFRDLLAELSSGTGRGEGFPDAITSVMSVAGSCP